MSSRSRYVIVLAGIAAVASAGSAVGFSKIDRKSKSDGAAMQLAPSTGVIAPLGENPDDGVAALAKGLSIVRNPQVGQAGPLDGNGNALRFDLAVSSFDGPAIARAMWEANVFVGAVADKYAASRLTPITAVDATLVRPNGQRMPIGGGLGDVVRNQRFLPVTSDVIDSIRRRAEEIGLSDTRVSVLRGIQDVVVIMGTAETPRDVVARLRAGGSVLASLLGGSPTRYEGVYLEVADALGAPAYIEAAAPRDGAGTAWARPGLGIEVGHMAHYG